MTMYNCDLHASFLVPAYNLPSGMLSYHVTTLNGKNSSSIVTTDIWLINASKDNPKESMIASLSEEAKKYQDDLEKENNIEDSLKINELKKAKALFSKLVEQAKNPVCHKKPDNKLLENAHNSFAMASYSACEPDLKNYLYLSGYLKREER